MILTEIKESDWIPEEYKELFNLSPEELLKVECTQYWQPCCVLDCKRKTGVVDFGVQPFYYWARRKEWIYTDGERYYCSTHWPIFEKKPNDLIYKEFPDFYPVKK